jgi:hypothetical protein
VQIFRSGAFLQQCWAVHPLCITAKRMANGNKLILNCTSCRSVHQLTLSSVEVRASAVFDGPDSAGSHPTSEDAQGCLADCLSMHAAALSVREMDVFKDFALLRCAECRRHYALTVGSFETHQR